MLAEDHQLVAAALQSLIAADLRIEVIGCARAGNEAVALVKEKKPDVLVLDLHLPGLHGFDVLREVHELTKVCIVSMYDDEQHIVQAMRAGAMGYVCKTAAPAELTQAIRALAQGETYFCTEAQKAALRFKSTLLGISRDRLTERETTVLKLAALGKSSTEVATELGISRRTAEAHRSNLMKKLVLTNQTELVLYALRVGMIEIPPLPAVAKGN